MGAGSKDEAHVLTGHRGEVGEPAPSETVDHLRRLIEVVANDEAPQKRVFW